MATQQQLAIDNAYRLATLSAGRRVTYRRLNPAVSVPITAIVGKNQHTAETDFGVVLTTTRDYTVSSAELGVTPMVGDRIEDQIGLDLEIYEVTEPSGQACYNSPDPENKWIRIHTKLVDIE